MKQIIDIFENTKDVTIFCDDNLLAMQAEYLTSNYTYHQVPVLRTSEVEQVINGILGYGSEWGGPR